MNAYKKPFLLIMVFLFLSGTIPLQAYKIDLEFMTENPMIFPIGQLIPGDLSDSRVNFEEIEPFFQIMVTEEPSDANAPAKLYLHIRLQSGNEVIFTVGSAEFDPNNLLIGPINNNGLARIEGINLGQNSNIRAQEMMRFIDGANLRSGYYTLSLVLSAWNNWDNAVGDNWGMVSRSFNVINPSQVDLLEPLDQDGISNYPIFIWSFPSEIGVVCSLKVVLGSENENPSTAMEFAGNEEIIASVAIPVSEQHFGGNIISWQYTGIGVRTLESDSTYFWQVKAYVPSIMPGQAEEISSPIYSFGFSPDLAGGGEGEENPPPAYLAPVFTLLQENLPEDIYTVLLARFGSFEGWNLDRVRIDGNEVSMAELALFFRVGDFRISSITVSQ